MDRLGKIASGFAGAAQAPIGLVWDLARAPFADEEELDGFVNTVYGSITRRGGQLLGGAIGPTSGLGAAFGGLPEAVRAPVRTVYEPVSEALETAGREYIREPLSTVITAASLNDAGQGFDLRRAHKIAQTRSWGQALALAFTAEDITDEASVAKAAGTDWYKAISGTADGLSRLFLEPDILIGGGVSKVRAAGTASRVGKVVAKLPERVQPYMARGIRNAHDVEAALARPELRTVNDRIMEIRNAAPDVDTAAAQIRNLAFPDHRDGGTVARVLAEADDLDVAWGALLGRRREMDLLRDQRADLAGQLDRIQGEQAILSTFERAEGQLPFDLEARRMDLLTAEHNALYPEKVRLDRMDSAIGLVEQMPRISHASSARHRLTRSDFYASKAGAPLRVAFNMRPRSLVDLDDAAGDVQVQRMLEKARTSIEDQDRLRGEYMGATNAAERSGVLAEAEALSIRSIAERQGASPQAVDQLVAEAARARESATTKLANSRAADAKGRAHFNVVDDKGVTHKSYNPAASSANFFPMADLDALENRLTAIGRFKARHPSADVPNDLLERFQALWKPAVLLRVGWPIRVVGEEQVRIMAMIGAMATVRQTTLAGGRYVADTVRNATAAARRIPKDERISAEYKGIRLGSRDVHGWEMESAFGTPENLAEQFRHMNEGGARFGVPGAADAQRNRLRDELLGEWQSVLPDADDWPSSWETAVTRIADDTVQRRFLEGSTVDEAATWLRTTPEGRAYLEAHPHWKSRTEDWLTAAKETVDEYAPTAELRVAALEGRASAAAFPEGVERPIVSLAVVDDIHGTTRTAKELGSLRDKVYHWLGALPTNTLSRQPYFEAVYNAEVTRLVDIFSGQGVDFTPELADRISRQARSRALGDSKRLLYDLAEESELSHMLRFVSPFYSAWQEVLTRWTGIAVTNPAFIGRMKQVWRSPEKAGLVVDEDGNRINPDGTATSALGDKVEPGAERLITLPLPKWAFNDFTRHVPGVKGAEAMGGVRLPKDGFNTILQGMPGVGPIVAIPLGEIAKTRPELEDSLKWALPFGAPQSVMDSLMPATAKRLKTRFGGEEDRTYSATVVRIFSDELVKFNLGQRTDKPTYTEAKRKADDFYNMRAIASFVSPVAPQFTSPFQPYIDAYRALKEKDPETADEVFLDTYGEEFFPLTVTLSKSMNGVPPTIEGAVAQQKYMDMIERHPELGSLILGAEGAGEFARSVYDSQFATKVRPGSADTQRRALPFEEATEAPDIRLGWIEYRKMMDLVEAARIQRGLPNLLVKGATDLANFKRAMTEKLAEKYPEWYRKLTTVDKTKNARMIAGMREIAADERLAGRPDISGLRQYLEVRDVLAGELERRDAAGGSKTLDAGSNADIARWWASVTSKMTEGNLAFSDLFYRWLEHDKIEVG